MAGEFSKPKVIQSGKGWYVGTIWRDREKGVIELGQVLSDYVDSKAQAVEMLPAVVEENKWRLSE